MKSESASLKNLDKYEWHTYNGKKKVKLNNRGRIEYLSEGKKFGIRPLIRGGGSTVTFEDNLKVDFRITDKEATSIMSRSKKARKPTNLIGKLEKSKKTRTRPTESDNATRKHNFDAVRYQGDGKRLPSPKTAGVDFSRFQWRKIQAPIVTIQKTKQNKQVFEKNALIGMRFDSPARGGIVTDTQGMTSKVTTELYDHIVEGSKLLPKNKWPVDKISSSDIAEAKRDENEREAQREQVRKAREKKKQEEVKQARLAKRKQQKAERKERIAREKGEVEYYKKKEEGRIAKEQEQIKKRSKPLSSDDKLKAYLDSSLENNNEEDDELIGDIDLDSDGNEAEPEALYDEDDLDGSEEDEDDSESTDEGESDPEEEGDADDIEVEEPDLGSRDLDKEKINSEIDDALGEEIDKKRSDLGLDDVEGDEEDDLDFADDEDEDGVVDDEDDEDLEDESDEDLDDDTDEEEDDGLGSDDFGMDDEDFGDEDEDVNIADEELGDGDEDTDSEDDDEEEGDEDLDTEDADEEEGDADTEDDETESDSEKAEKETDSEDDDDSKPSDKDKKDKVKDSKEEQPEDYEPKLADVVRFRKDKTDKREFMLLDKYDLKNNANVTAYKFYDITNQPDKYQLVLISKDKKMHIGKQVEKVRRGDMEEYRDFLRMLPNLEESREAIAS